MKIAIIYSSKTNNTKLLANALNSYLSNYEIVYFGKPNKDCIDADIYFIGSWTDKGNASEEIIELLKSLNNKNIAYFATAGFGCSSSYFDQLFNRVKTNINESNKILGYYICQGKMPISVKQRYQSILDKNPEDKKIQLLIDNFNQALTHPDNEDITNLLNWADSIVDKINK